MRVRPALVLLLALLALPASAPAAEPVVAVLDSGVDLRHPALQSRLWTNPGEVPGNRVDDDGNGRVDDVHGFDIAGADSDPSDPRGHGTHVAGIAARRGFVRGLGRPTGARIMAVRVLDRSGTGAPEHLADGLEYATRMGADIINLSVAYYGDDPRVQAALERAAAAGALIVAAAGNGGENLDRSPVYPASYRVPNMLVVAAVDRAGRLASWSAHGSSTVDLMAPGVDIRSSVPGRRYGRRSGTSQAAAVVTRAAAVLLAQAPAPAPAVRAALIGGTRPVAASPTIAGGVVDITRALGRLLN